MYYVIICINEFNLVKDSSILMQVITDNCYIVVNLHCNEFILFYNCYYVQWSLDLTKLFNVL